MAVEESLPLLSAVALTKVYERSRKGDERPALDGVDLEVPEGTVVAVVGRSGSGKSTLGRLLTLHEAPSAGEVFYAGRGVSTLTARERRRIRPRLQLVLQDPAAALNPRLRAVDAVAEPLLVQGRERAAARRDALELMAEVGLSRELGERRAPELSGGQKQRLTIARALAAEPRLIVLDEAFSGLDLPHQAQAANLLMRLQERFALSYVLISHDLRLVGHLADAVVVMSRGRVVERGDAKEILTSPAHEATRELVEAATAQPLNRGNAVAPR